MIRRRDLFDRKTHKRDARLFIIVVEGETTEPSYFQALDDNKLIIKSRVIPYVVPPENGKSAPKYLISNAEIAKTECGPLSPRDEIWIVFDVDEHSGSSRIEQIHSALHDIETQKWFVALSNPCFEVWLLLHVTDDLEGITDYGASAEDKLRITLGAYSKSNTPAQCLDLNAIQSAITRAREIDTDPNSPIPELPGTRVYRLVERLVSAKVA